MATGLITQGVIPGRIPSTCYPPPVYGQAEKVNDVAAGIDFLTFVSRANVLRHRHGRGQSSLDHRR